MHFENGTKWAREAGLLTFVPNFLVPQQNSLGRLLPRYDLRNPVFFVESLNKELHALIDKTPNTYIIDIYAISTLFGRRYIQDDSIMANSHGSALTDYGQNIDAARIEHPGAILDIYNNKSVEFYIAIWREIIAMYRTIRQIDAIKLVVIDLDDTLWRGVIAEGEDITSDHTEGWPTGFAEALSFLRRRGVVLAILSKNDPERIEQLWEKIYGGRLKPWRKSSKRRACCRAAPYTSTTTRLSGLRYRRPFQTSGPWAAAPIIGDGRCSGRPSFRSRT
jgi:hypothetical protein